MVQPLQDRISEFNKNELIPALNEVCDQLLDANQRLRIDRLEIDIGILSMDKLEAEFKNAMVSQFKNKLQEMVIKNPTLLEPIQKNQAPYSAETGKTESIEMNKIDLLFYFLENGALPWWVSKNEFKIEQLVASVLLNSPKLLQKKLLPLLASKNIRLRLAHHFSDKQFICLIDPEDKLELNLLWNKILDQFQENYFKPQVLNQIKLIVFEKVLAEVQFFERIPQQKHQIKKAFLKAIIALRPETADEIISYKKQRIKAVDANAFLLKLVEDFSLEELSEIINISVLKPAQRKDSNASEQEREEEKLLKSKKLPADTFIEINNAGIVLLWPFLQLFFKELKLIEDKTFVDEESNWKAVQLLHFLAFGNEVAEEPQWALNKILCGLKVSDFVPTEFSLNEAEKAECNNLLQAVVNNWKVLKNTSVQGLQKSFLVRNGLLKKDQNGFIIEIERITIDLLLDKLNWTLSVISLPWNNGLIHVKW